MSKIVSTKNTITPHYKISYSILSIIFLSTILFTYSIFSSVGIVSSNISNNTAFAIEQTDDYTKYLSDKYLDDIVNEYYKENNVNNDNNNYQKEQTG